MRTDASGKLALKPTSDQQENIKNNRKTLKVLQQTATDKENLVGRAQRSGKEILPKLQNFNDTDLESKKKVKLINKFVQTVDGFVSGIKIDENDLTSEAGPSENYWEVIAERRRLALDETLEENQRLHEANESLKEENQLLKDMLDESRNLVEVLTEMLAESDNNEEESNESQDDPPAHE